MDLLILLASVLTLIACSLVKQFWFSVIGATILTTFIFAWLTGGHIGGNVLDPKTWNDFFIKNVGIAFAASLGVSIVVAFVFRQVKSMTNKKGH